MKAARIHEFGGPEVLHYEDVSDPKPRKDEVLVRVRACAMNHLDLWIRKGLPGIALPHILGSDVAGEIVEIGEYVSGFSEASGCCWRRCGSAITAPSVWLDCKTNARNSQCLATGWTEEIVS